MKTYSEPARELPIVGDYDVLVCGGGTSGIPAAISAARAGAKVALIERYGFLGGVPAMNIMPCWHGLIWYHSGLLTEWAQRVSGVTQGPDPLVTNNMEPEAVKLLALEMLDEAGVEIHLHSWIAGTVKEGNVVRGIITESKSGRRVFMAKCVIDATGDGDVAFHAGAEYHIGDTQGLVQGMTVRFRLSGIDFARYFDWIGKNRECCSETDSQIDKLRARALAGQDFYIGGDLSPLYRKHRNGANLPVASYFNCSSIRPGELSCNATRVERLDGTVEEDLTKAEVVCRKQIRALHDFLRECVDGFQNSRLLETAPQIGVRESRIIVADYLVTEEDCRKAVRFEDSIFRAGVAFDLHNPGKHTCEVLKDDHYIPYRALLAKGLDRLMVIGRAMSSDHVANSSTRQMYKVFTVGEVAGLAAALAVRANIAPRALPYPELKAAMIERGIRFE